MALVDLLSGVLAAHTTTASDYRACWSRETSLPRAGVGVRGAWAKNLAGGSVRMPPADPSRTFSPPADRSTEIHCHRPTACAVLVSRQCAGQHVAAGSQLNVWVIGCQVPVQSGSECNLNMHPCRSLTR